MLSSHPPALCLFVRDEVLDITEWLVHHAAIGCGRFLIYDNGSTDGTSELLTALAEHLPITAIRWPGDTLGTLLGAYEDCIARFGTRHGWIGFLEVDEFLIPPPGATLGDLLARHDGDESFVISRLTFGSAGLRRSQGRPVMEAFTRRGVDPAPPNAAVRSFVRPGRVRAVVNPCLIATEAPAVTLTGAPAVWSPRGPGLLAEAQVARGDFALHHYATRSDTHWVGGRGRPGLRSWRELSFEEADLNDESDFAALPYAEQVAAVMQGQYPAILARHVLPRMHLPPAAAAEDVVCHIDALGPAGVIGWVYNGADPVAPPPLRLLVDGNEVGFIRPHLPREDVTATGIMGVRLGFAVRIPLRWFDGQPHELTACLDDGAEVGISWRGVLGKSCGFAELYSPRFESAFDGFAGVHARGWVLREDDIPGRLVGKVKIMITCGDRTVGQFTADMPRADVGLLFADQPDAKQCGFEAYIPKAFRKAEPQIFRVMTLQDGIDLKGSPMTWAFT